MADDEQHLLGGRPGGTGPDGDAPSPEGAERSTGDAAVDEALRSLDGLGAQPLTAHVAAFDAVHGALQDRLAEAQG